MPQLSIVIIDNDQKARTAIELALGNKVILAGSAADLISGIGLIQAKTPSVVILQVTRLDTGIEQLKKILAISPHSSLFVTCDEKNPDWILGLLRAGAVEFLLRPVVPKELFEALQKVPNKQSLQHPLPVAQKQGKIISVYNPVGGVGTTTVAVNIAATLAAASDNVALVDFNLFCGDVASFLDMNPKYTLSSVTNNVSRLDAQFLRSSMARHKSGIYLLSEPLEVEETLGITADQINQVLTFLKSAFAYVVIDTGGPLFGGNLVTFRDSDHLIFNTVLTLPALKNARRYLIALEKQELDRNSVKIVVNRYLPKSDIKLSDAENVLGTKIFSSIPNEYGNVIDSINQGTPVVNLYPQSPLTVAISKLVSQLTN